MSRYLLLFCFAFSLFADRSSMTGDWYGVRQRGRDAGIDFTASYANDLLGNPVGGKHRGFANAGSFGVNLILDLEKICRFNQTILFSSFVVRHGNNLSATKIDNQFPVAQLFGRETYGLCELYLLKTFWQRRIMVKVGRLAGGNDFLDSPLYQRYVNNSFCGNPISIFFNTLFTAYPNATWGAYAHIRPRNPLLFKFACYNNNANIFKNKYHGVYFDFKSTQGLTFITEWVYLALWNNLPGNYKIGGYYITGDVPKLLGGAQLGNYGYYLLLDQTIYQKGPKAITPFVTFLFAPSNRNQFPFFFTSGLVFRGIFPGRDTDNLSLGASLGSYSSDIQPKQTYESVLEANYWFWVNEWVAITPDVQYIINPKGLNTIPNAFVAGVQIFINL